MQGMNGTTLNAVKMMHLSQSVKAVMIIMRNYET